MKILNFIQHTYIIGHYNLSVRIINRVSHTTSVVDINFIHNWWDLQFNVESKRQIFEKFYMAVLITLKNFPENLLRGNRRKNTFCILFWCLAWGMNSDFTSRSRQHYLLDCGDFYLIIFQENFSFFFSIL